MKRVLVTIDGTQRSLDALRATVLAGSGAIERIELVNVQPLLSRHIAQWIPRNTREAWRAERSSAALAPARQFMESSTTIPWRAHAVAGPAQATIEAMARELGCNEVVAAPPPRLQRLALPAGLGLVALMLFADQ